MCVFELILHFDASLSPLLAEATRLTEAPLHSRCRAVKRRKLNLKTFRIPSQARPMDSWNSQAMQEESAGMV